MPTRRDFVKLAAAVSVAGMVKGLSADPNVAGISPTPTGAGQSGAADRSLWCGISTRLAEPLFSAAAERRLKKTMPVEAHPSSHDRTDYTHLEGLARLLVGLAPWFELGPDSSPEGAARGRLLDLARAGIDAATDPTSPDFLNFSKGGQPLVDAAFLAQALLRAPNRLWGALNPRTRSNVISALEATRVITPGESNWKLFATMVEVFLEFAGAKRDDGRLFEGLAKHRTWYVGDGVYGDGPEYHWDYYNSFVIQPMLVEALDRVGHEAAEWFELRELARGRLSRWAAIQERMIAPDGSYPPIGRSIAYRCGAFQGLALACLRTTLPVELSPGQARVALTRVIRRTLEAPGTFDERGWLRIGLSGHQPALGEPYISTGSVYLCSAALLPLGLPPDAPFWTAPAEATTWEKAWSGVDLPADHALRSQP